MQPTFWATAIALHTLLTPVQVLRIDGALDSARERAAKAASANPSAHSHARVRALVAEAVAKALPPHFEVAQVALAAMSPAGPRALRGNELRVGESARVDVRLHQAVAVGPQPVSVLVTDAAGQQLQLAATVTLRGPAKAGIVIKRGADVQVRARSGSVMVQTRGIAQSAAALGEQLVVLCENATRTLTATAVGSKEVEVQL